MANNSRGPVIQDNWDFNSAPPRVTGNNLFNSEYQNVASDGSSGGMPPLKPGYLYQTYDGRVFKYCELADTTALAEGDLIVPYTVSAAGTSAATSATDSVTITATMASVVANEFRGGYLWCTAGTGIGQMRRIVANTATVSGVVTFTLERAYGTALASATVVAAHPYKVKQMPASYGAGGVITGVSFGTITAATGAKGQAAGFISYFGWVQVAGLCENVKFTGSLVAPTTTTQSIGLVPSTTAGTAAQLGTTAINNTQFGSVWGAVAAAVTSPTKVPAVLFGCQG